MMTKVGYQMSKSIDARLHRRLYWPKDHSLQDQFNSDSIVSSEEETEKEIEDNEDLNQSKIHQYLKFFYEGKVVKLQLYQKECSSSSIKNDKLLLSIQDHIPPKFDHGSRHSTPYLQKFTNV